MFEAIRSFRDKLEAGRTCVGVGITLADPQVSEALAESVDFFWIDTEHTLINPETLAGHLRMARYKKVPGLVRVAGCATHLIKPVLDSGAHGIIVPQIRSAEEARQAVTDCIYPPAGKRGFGPRIPSDYGRDMSGACVGLANENLFIAVQIETVEALAEVDEIVSIPRLDSIVVGPYDLSHDMGKAGKVEDPEVVAALEQVIARARARGLFVGTGMEANPDYARRMAARGVQWIQVGCDFEYLIQRADSLRAAVLGSGDRPSA